MKNSLRMRPDRVIVGECRGSEALDMIQAMNTGHDGSMTTVHANSAREVIERLEVLVLMAADLPVASIHRQIASALDLIVHISRLPGGARVITQVSEVVRYDPDEKQIVVTDIFNYRNGVACGRPATCRRSSTRWWRRSCWNWSFFTAGGTDDEKTMDA